MKECIFFPCDVVWSLRSFQGIEYCCRSQGSLWVYFLPDWCSVSVCAFVLLVLSLGCISPPTLPLFVSFGFDGVGLLDFSAGFFFFFFYGILSFRLQGNGFTMISSLHLIFCFSSSSLTLALSILLLMLPHLLLPPHIYLFCRSLFFLSPTLL